MQTGLHNIHLPFIYLNNRYAYNKYPLSSVVVVVVVVVVWVSACVRAYVCECLRVEFDAHAWIQTKLFLFLLFLFFPHPPPSLLTRVFKQLALHHVVNAVHFLRSQSFVWNLLNELPRIEAERKQTDCLKIWTSVGYSALFLKKKPISEQQKTVTILAIMVKLWLTIH